MSKAPLPQLPEDEDEGHGLNTTWFRRAKKVRFLFKLSSAWLAFWFGILLFILLLAAPAGTDWLIQRVVNELNRRTGLNFHYADVAVKPWSAAIAFIDMSVTNPASAGQGSSKPLVQIKRVDVGLNLWRAINEHELAVEVGVTNPPNIALDYDMDGGVKLPENFATVLAGLKRLGGAGASQGLTSATEGMVTRVVHNESRWRLRSLDINGLNMDVRFTSGTDHQVFSAHEMMVGLTRHDSTHSVSASGVVRGPETLAPFKLTCQLSREWAPENLEIMSEKARFSWPVINPAWTVQAMSLNVKGTRDRDVKTRRDSMGIAADAAVLTVQRYASSQTITDYNFSTTGALEILRNAADVPVAYDVRRLSVSSRYLDAQASGTVAMDSSCPWVLGMDVRRLEGDWQGLLVGFSPASWDMKMSAGHFGADAQAQGYGRKIHSLTGQVDFSDVTVDMQQLPAPLHSVCGRALLSRDKMELANLSGASQDGTSSAAMSAVLTGDWLHRSASMLDAKWDFALDMSKMVHTVRDDGMVTGTLISRGEINGVPLMFHQAGGMVPQMSGSFRVEGFSAIGSELPVDVRHVNAEGDLTESQARLHKVTGEICGVDVNATATLTRDEQDYAWRNPQVEGHAELGGSLSRILQSVRDSRLTTSVREARVPDWLRNSRADIAAEADWSGPAKAPAAWRPKVQIGAKNLDVLLERPSMRTTMTLESLYAQFDGHRFTLSEAVCVPAEGVKLGFNGTGASGEDVVLSFAGKDIDTHSFLNIMTYARAWQSVDGKVDLNGKITLPAELVPDWGAAQSDGVTCSQLLDWMRQLGPAMSAAYKSGKLLGDGTMTAKGGEYTHYSMPEVRTDDRGNRVPEACIKAIRGKVSWSLVPKSKDARNLPPCMYTVFEVPKSAPLSVSLPGSDADASLSGKMIIRPSNYPVLDLDLSVRGDAALDPWTKGWGIRMKRLRAEHKIPPSHPEKHDRRFDLILRMDARNAMMRNVNLGKFNGELKYDYSNTSDERRSWHISLPKAVSSPKNGGSIEYSLQMDQDNDRLGASTPSPLFWKHLVQLNSVSATDVQEFLFPMDGHRFYGVINAGDVVWAGVNNDKTTYYGGGTFTAENFQMIGSPVFGALGQAVGLDMQRMVFNTENPARFVIDSGILYLGKTVPATGVRNPPLHLTANRLQLSALGTYSFRDNTVDMALRLGLLRTAGINVKKLGQNGRDFVEGGVGNVPLVGMLLPGVAGAAAHVAGAAADSLDKSFSSILGFHVGGTLSHPQVAPVPVAGILELFKPQ